MEQLRLAQLITSVKDAPEVNAVFAESVPVKVMVYVPFGGSDNVFPLVPPQAESTRPTDARAIKHANCRNLRDELPRNPASKRPANAIPAGRGALFRAGLLAPIAEPLVRGMSLRPRPFNTPPVVGLPAQSVALVSIVICPAMGEVPLTETDPLLFKPVPTSKQRFARAVSLDVAYVKFTVPVYPPAGVTVQVSLCCDPLLTVRLDGESATLKLPFPALVPPTVRTTLPADEAWVPSPAY
jgi:hypothetical protein